MLRLANAALPAEGGGRLLALGITKKLGAMWQSLSREHRVPYEELAAADKVRYLEAMKTYVSPPPSVAAAEVGAAAATAATAAATATAAASVEALLTGGMGVAMVRACVAQQRVRLSLAYKTRIVYRSLP